MSIVEGQLQIWDSGREGAVARRPVCSVPVDRVVSFEPRGVKAVGDVDNAESSTPSALAPSHPVARYKSLERSSVTVSSS